MGFWKKYFEIDEYDKISPKKKLLRNIQIWTILILFLVGTFDLFHFLDNIQELKYSYLVFSILNYILVIINFKLLIKEEKNV